MQRKNEFSKDKKLKKEYVCPTCIADVWKGLDAEGFWSAHRPHSACAFQQLDVAIAYELPQIMHSSVNMPRALPISGIFAHYDTRGIILPYFSGADGAVTDAALVKNRCC